MPIYEFKCIKCGKEFEKIMSINELCEMKCECGGKAFKQLSAHRARAFDAQFIEDVQNKPIYVRNKQEVTDAVNRFNDSELASKQGKVRVYE